MSMTEDELWLLRDLDARSPKSARSLPVRPGTDQGAMEEAAWQLIQRKYVLVDGPPNQNSGCGKDVDLIVLLPLGEQALAQVARH